MAKRKSAASATATRKKDDPPPAEAKAEGKAEGKGKGKTKPAGPAKAPAEPFGDMLPNATEQGSPADGTWKPKGDPVADIATLEGQERFLYRVMVKAKAERDVAKAQAKLVMCQAEETSVSDGFTVAAKTILHKQADTAERKAAKHEKEWKRAKDGWNAVKGMLHRYMTEPDRPLIEQVAKKGRAA